MIKLTFGKYKNPLIMYSIVMIIIIMVAIPLGLSEDAGPNWLRYSPTNNAAHDVIYMMIMITIDVIVRVYILEGGWEYFRTWTIWIAFGEIVFLSALIGALMKPLNGEKESGKKMEEKSG